MSETVYLDERLDLIEDKRLYASIEEYRSARLAYEDAVDVSNDGGVLRPLMKAARIVAAETCSTRIEVFEALRASLRAYLLETECRLPKVVLTDDELGQKIASMRRELADEEPTDDDGNDELVVASEAWATETGHEPCDPEDVVHWLRVVESLIDSDPQVGSLLKKSVIAYDTGDEIGVMFPKRSSFALRMLEREDINGRVVAAVCDEFGGVRVMRYSEQP